MRRTLSYSSWLELCHLVIAVPETSSSQALRSLAQGTGPTRRQPAGLGKPYTLQPKAGHCRQQNSLSLKGSAAHSVCPRIVLRLESLCWQICIGFPVPPVQYFWRGPRASLFSPLWLIPHDGEQHTQRSQHVHPWVSLWR